MNDKNDDDEYFDKFMNDICRREDAAKEKSKNLSEFVSDQQKLNILYREKWQNRITWGKK